MSRRPVGRIRATRRGRIALYILAGAYALFAVIITGYWEGLHQ